jgi:hypothetical protein
MDFHIDLNVASTIVVAIVAIISLGYNLKLIGERLKTLSSLKSLKEEAALNLEEAERSRKARLRSIVSVMTLIHMVRNTLVEVPAPVPGGTIGSCRDRLEAVIFYLTVRVGEVRPDELCEYDLKKRERIFSLKRGIKWIIRETEADRQPLPIARGNNGPAYLVRDLEAFIVQMEDSESVPA